MSVAGNSCVVSAGCSAVSVTHPVPWQMVGLNSTALEEYSCLYQRDDFWSHGKEIFLFHNIWFYKEDIFFCILLENLPVIAGKKTKKKQSSVTKHMQVFRNNHPLLLNLWPTLCPSVWPKRTQMEAHSVLAAPHKCAEMLSSSRATHRAEPRTVGSMLSYSNKETPLQHLPQGSRLQAYGNLSLHPFPLIALLFLEFLCFNLPPPCVSPAADDELLRCVCCSWCCESGRWQTPPITRLFHNTRVAPYHCRRDEEPPRKAPEGGGAMVFTWWHRAGVHLTWTVDTFCYKVLASFVLCWLDFHSFIHIISLFEFVMSWTLKSTTHIM